MLVVKIILVNTNHIWTKRCIFLLKNDGHNIVPDMTFPLKLLGIPNGKRQESRDVEHDFFAFEARIDRLKIQFIFVLFRF